MKKMLIHARDPGLVRVAILGSDGVLEDLDIESHEHKSLKGSLYKARVVRLEPALGAAFVDFGESKNGFLPLHEVSGRILAETGSSRAKDRVLERGQEVLVQVTREPVGGKGAALTTYIALPGRYLVYLPGGEEGGISRKISSKEERSKLSELVRAIRGQADVGLIVRTAGKDRSKAELQRDFRALGQLWRDILATYRGKKEPGLVWSERGVATRIVRDYYTEEVGEVWVDDSRIYEEVRSFFREALPRKALGRVRFYEGNVPLFHRYRVEDQINQARTRRVSLPSGGSIVIDPTEALVAIDVNSGKLRGEKGIEETAFRTNSEAAREAARQLRLRNLGGIIVIDFIDMRSKKKQQDVERILREALKPDKANVTVGHIGPFGTLEMLRQRLRTSGPWAGFVSCPACEGTGRVPKVRQEALDALREARSRAAQGAQAEPAVIPLSPQVASYLLESHRQELEEIERVAGSRVRFEVVSEGAVGAPSPEPPAVERMSGEEAETPKPQEAPTRRSTAGRRQGARPSSKGKRASEVPIASGPNPPAKKKNSRGSRGGRRRRKKPATESAAGTGTGS